MFEQIYLNPMFLPMVFVFGLMVGSFTNVLIHRLPREMSIVFPASHCPSCGSSVRAWQNLPIISYIFLRGRCATCKTKFGIRYPITELFVGVLYLWLWMRIENPYLWAASVYMATVTVALMIIDLETMLLPDSLVLTTAVAGLMMTASGVTTTNLYDALVAGLGSAACFWLLGALFMYIRKVEGLGFGDVKLMAMVGFFAGTAGILWTILIGSTVGTVIGIAAMAITGRDRSMRIPFGPFLGLGFLIYMLYGPNLNLWLGLPALK